MARISKPPEIRRQELLDTAMELFTRKGYEETSMSDIAQAAGVAQGLCYRYFDSKRKLFQEAMERYGEACCQHFLPVIHDRSKSIRERLDLMAEEILHSDRTSQYSAFYHQPENAQLHRELNWKICRFLVPHVAEELRAACQTGELSLRYPEIAASYMLHGQIGLVGEDAVSIEERVTELRRYADLILSGG